MARIRALASVNSPPTTASRFDPLPPPFETITRIDSASNLPGGVWKLAFSSSFPPLSRSFFLITLLSSYRWRVTILGPFACISPRRKGSGCILGLSTPSFERRMRVDACARGSINPMGTVKFLM